MSPSKFRVRAFFRGVVYSLARPLAQRGVRPDSISYFTLLLSLSAALCLILFLHQPLFGLLVFLTGLFDGVDGAVAELEGSATQAGALIDSVVDRVAELILFLGIALSFQNEILVGLPVTVWSMVCMAGSFLTSYTRARAESLGASDLDIGFGGRSERLLILVIFSLLSLTRWGLITVALIGLLTAAYRFWHYTNQLRSAG